MVIRDLTLRSAASFGSFHLIRLLYDEYMYYLIEQRVASFRNTNAVVVMGEVSAWPRLQHYVLLTLCPFFLNALFTKCVTFLEHSKKHESSTLVSNNPLLAVYNLAPSIG